MTRKSIFEVLSQKHDLEMDLSKISILFNKKQISLKNNSGIFNSWSIEDIADSIFHEWKGRSNCIHCRDMRKDLNIDKYIKKAKNSETLDINDILLCLEYYINIYNICMNKFFDDIDESSCRFADSFTILKQNIGILLNKTNHKIYHQKEKDIWLLIPYDSVSTSVAEISTDETGMAILMYHHRQLKGDLEGKRQLLLKIANEYEPLLKKELDGFKDYFSKSRELLNKLNIRHNNGNNEFLQKMSDEDLENWYDETYQLILFCVLIKDNMDRKAKAKELLKEINQK